MHAAYVEALGPASAIRVGELPDPVPGPTDVLVSVDLVAANPVDTYVRSGRYPTRTPLPFVVGRDLVGTVAGAGAGSGFSVGEQVWCNSLGHDGRQGSFADFAVVPAERCYRAPAGADLMSLVATAHPAATAFLGWFVHARLRPGETVYVGGAAGNVGSAATVLAHQAGARVVGGARPADHDRCRAAGAAEVVDYRGPGLAARLRAVAPDGLNVFWDTSGHHDFSLVADVCTRGARVLLTAAAVPAPVLAVAETYTRDISLHGFVISRATVTDLAAAAATVADLCARGLLVPRVSEVLPLTATSDVHQRLERGEIHGRVVLHP